MVALQPEDRVFRTRAALYGGHWHVTIFSAKRADLTFAKLGDLIMDKSDYRRFVQLFPAQHIDDTARQTGTTPSTASTSA